MASTSDSKPERKRLTWRKWIKRRGKELIRRVNARLVESSQVPDVAWLDPKLFPWIPRLEAAAPVIQSELDDILEHRDALPRLHDLQQDQYRISADGRWKSFMLTGWGFRSKTGERLCPRTLDLVESIPGVRTAFFSLLEPGAEIPEHTGFAKGLLRCHLALRVPREQDRCVLWLDGKTHTWERDRAVVFDDTFLHAVRNDTDEDRIVLLLHFDRPMSATGRWLHRASLEVLRFTPFVRDARRNHARWEADWEKREAARAA